MKAFIITNQDTTLRFREELIQQLSSFCDVSVLASINMEKQWLQSLNVQMHDLLIDRRGTSLLKEVRTFLQIRKYLKKEEPNVILSFTIKPNLYAGLLAKWMRIPIVITVTGMGYAIEETSLLRRFVFFLYRQVQYRNAFMVYQNESIKDYFEKMGVKATHSFLVHGSGVNIEMFNYQPYPVEKQGIRFVYISRLLKSKGIDELAKAMNILIQQHANIYLDIVGPIEGPYEDLVNQLVSTGVVTYHGYQEDVRLFISNAHAIVHPTYYEGMSNVLLEASAIGRPILASNVPGCIEIFEEGLTGFGFEPKDLKSLLHAMENFISLSWEESEQMGKLGRERTVKLFNRNDVVKTYMDIIKTLVPKK